MSSPKLPGYLLAGTAAAFLVWAIVLLMSPGGSVLLEWIQLLVSAGLLVFGTLAIVAPSQARASQVRWTLLVFAIFGAVAVIGLAADDNSSRTWMRLAWAALLSGSVTSLIAWWGAPSARRGTVIAGGVVAVVLIVAGAGITFRCDPTIQRSWCDPLFEQEQALAEIVVVDGDLQRVGRAGGDGGAALRAYFISGGTIVDNTEVPDGFVYEERPIQSIEVQRGRYTATTGPNSNCRIDVKVEQIPAGTVQTVMVTCRA